MVAFANSVWVRRMPESMTYTVTPDPLLGDVYVWSRVAVGLSRMSRSQGAPVSVELAVMTASFWTDATYGLAASAIAWAALSLTIPPWKTLWTTLALAPISFVVILSAETPVLSCTMYVSVVESAKAAGVGTVTNAARVARTASTVGRLRRRRMRVSFARGYRLFCTSSSSNPTKVRRRSPAGAVGRVPQGPWFPADLGLM